MASLVDCSIIATSNACACERSPCPSVGYARCFARSRAPAITQHQSGGAAWRQQRRSCARTSRVIGCSLSACTDGDAEDRGAANKMLLRTGKCAPPHGVYLRLAGPPLKINQRGADTALLAFFPNPADGAAQIISSRHVSGCADPR